MTINSNNKGKRGERLACRYLEQLFPGLSARRGVQYAGGPDSPDVVCSRDGVPVDVHVEVKFCQQPLITAWIAQARADAGGLPWLIIWKRNHYPPVYFAQQPEVVMARLSGIEPAKGQDT